MGDKAREARRAFYGKKGMRNNVVGEAFLCNFCGKIAKRIIVNTEGKILFSCSTCIAPYERLPWIKSIETIM